MARWIEFTISKQGHKAFFDVTQAIVVRQAPEAEAITTLIDYPGGRISVMESVEDVMTVVKSGERA